MWWLIKGSFWFSLVLVLLPIFSSGSSGRLADAPAVEMFDAFSAVTGAYGYVTGLCTERPDVCEKGGKTFVALGYRAREGARIAFDYLDGQFGDDPAKTAARDGAGATAREAAGKPDAKPAPATPGHGGLAGLAGLAEAALGAGDGAALAEHADTTEARAPGPAGKPQAQAAVAPVSGGWKPQPYRPPVADAVLTGAVPPRVPVPLPRPRA